MKDIKRLTLYYGLLQTVHLSLLAWGGYIIFRTGRMIFLALPPLEGWSPQVVPFLMGLGIADAFAAGLGIYFAFQAVMNESWRLDLAMVSITIAVTSALVFLVGTLATGAWSHNLVEYLSMVVLFSPIPLLFFRLSRISVMIMKSERLTLEEIARMAERAKVNIISKN
jgi:hypothetical protein